MKKAIILTMFLALAIGVIAQEYDIQFSKFKLEWFSIMGFKSGGGQRLKCNFTNLSKNPLKYVVVHYWAINAVNDIETEQFGRRDFSVKFTGPFPYKKNIKQEVEIALFHPTLLRAYPYKIELTFMDDEEKEIEITEGNISTIFPGIEYIKIGNLDSVE